MGLLDIFKKKPATQEEIDGTIKEADVYMGQLKAHIGELDDILKDKKLDYAKVKNSIHLINKHLEQIKKFYDFIRRDSTNPLTVHWKKKINQIWGHVEKLYHKICGVGTAVGITETALAKQIDTIKETIIDDIHKEKKIAKKLR